MQPNNTVFGRHGYGLFWCVVFAGLFMAMPLLLLTLGFQGSVLLIFVIGASAIVVDELLTKMALKLGCKETNPFFNLLRKKIGEKYVHALITVLGVLTLLALAILYDNVLLLLIFAVGFNVPVVANALTLYGKICGDKTHDYNISQPPNA